MTGDVFPAGLFPHAVNDCLEELSAEQEIQLMAELAINVYKKTGKPLTEILNEVENEIYGADVLDKRLSA